MPKTKVDCMDKEEGPRKIMKLNHIETGILEKKRQNKHVSQISPVIVYADELDFHKHVLTRLCNDKKKGFRMVKLQISHENIHPLRIQFSNIKGRIPKKFGIDTNKHGKTNLTFDIPCEKEYSSVLAFQNDVKSFAKKSKSVWWNNEITDCQVDDNFYNLITVDRKEKDDGTGVWPGSMRVSIPMNENGELQNVVIVDENNERMSYYDLPGRQWDTIVIELSGIFFQNKFSWGFGPKKLRYIKLAPDISQNVNDINFETIVLPKKYDKAI